MDIQPYLKLMVEHGASDMFFSVGTRPKIKVEGEAVPVGRDRMTTQALRALAVFPPTLRSLLGEYQRFENEEAKLTDIVAAFLDAIVLDDPVARTRGRGARHCR